MSSTAGKQPTWFERHPRLTIIAVILAGTVFLDVLAAQTNKVLLGYSWADRNLQHSKAAVETQTRVQRGFRVPSELYDHDLAKNAAVENVIWGSTRYRVYTNSLGFRDRATREIALRSDKHRLVIMGDSFTEGVGVNFEETFAGIVEQELGKAGVEVLNAGVVSYSPIIYWKKAENLLENVGFKFDEMAVFLDISDPQDEARFYDLNDQGKVKRYKDVPDQLARGISGTPPPPPVKQSGSTKYASTLIRNNTILMYSLLRGPRELFTLRKEVKKEYGTNFTRALWTVEDAVYKDYGADGVERMRLYMNKLVELLRKHEVQLTVAVYPWPDQIIREDLNSKQVQIWQEWCEANHVRFINYFPAFVKKSSTTTEKEQVLDRYFLDGNSHWNERGHEVIAKGFLDAYLKESRN